MESLTIHISIKLLLKVFEVWGKKKRNSDQETFEGGGGKKRKGKGRTFLYFVFFCEGRGGGKRGRKKEEKGGGKRGKKRGGREVNNRSLVSLSKR